MKVALIYIIKDSDDEAEHLRRSLQSVAKHVDGIFINVNKKEGAESSEKLTQLLDEYKVNVIRTTWEDNFALARNANLAQVPEDYDWILWLDADDTIDNPEKIKEVAKVSDRYDSIFVDYLYDRDEEDNPQTVHLVARMFKNNDSHEWKGRIHETLIEKRGVTQGATKDFIVIHHAEADRTQRSFERNINLLEKQLADEAEDPDPRTFYYLASTLMDAGEQDRALELFTDYLTVSGWDQERSVALTKMGRIALDKGERSQAKEYFARAVAEDPANPEPRVEMGSLEIELKKYDKAIIWLEYVEKMDKNLTTLERNPMSYTFRTYLLLADAYLNLGGSYLPKAAKYAKKARKYKKKDPGVKEYTDMVIQIDKDRTELQDAITRFKKFMDKKQKRKAMKVLDSLPNHLADNPIVSALRNDGKGVKWPKRTIAIMTGDTMIDEWGPWSLKDGIGGSEEAIIRISKHLSDLGYKVVVFAKPGANAGVDENGVMWRNFWDCNLEDEFDIFIAWRAPFIFERKIKARKKYLWLHDVMDVGEFTPNRLNNIDKVLVLSKYHRSLFPNIPDEKIMLSANGIDPEEFEEMDKMGIKRDPHKVFYGSSHVRGLAYIYEVWPEVKKAVPEATLDVYYGRESYDAVHKGNPERMKWMDDMMIKAQKLDGVTDHGKVGQKEIMQHIFESGVWAYPCPFPEIYCITAIKAQAGGAVPVSSNFAALDETVQYGIKLPMKEQKEGTLVGAGDEEFLKPFKEALIDMLKHPEKQEAIRKDMMEWARTNSWRAVAEQWVASFNE
jgi:glycosyltransferase involved in cell wall biosynthesis/tetratricopeptide (TPR) repeat protein